MSRAHTERLREAALAFPPSPGVYLMKSGKGRVIYVGKAKDLSARVKSYLQKPAALDPKTAALMRAAEGIDYIATDSEIEALVLECTLIKEHHPRYNIRLKDDKRYPYLKLTMRERFPRLLLVRRIEKDGARYFGPFTDSRALRRTMLTIRTLFPLRDCGGESAGRTGGRACLNFHIGRCRGPCAGSISEAEYAELTRQVLLFLEGKSDRLAASLRDRMWRLSREKRYEAAATARDQLAALGTVTERQHAVFPGGEDADFIALAREGALACGVVLKVREGKILGRESFFLPADESDAEPEIFESFFELYYHSTADIPPRIYTQRPLAEAGLVAEWLARKRPGRVAITVPRRGDRRSLIELSLKNALLQLVSKTGMESRPASALRELKGALGLAATPVRIEAYDISNIQGSEAVGSLVAFERGMPSKKGYRRFRIRGVAGANDYAMMREVLSRRLGHLGKSGERSPDLILVDGGKGQISAARAALDDIGVTGIPIVGLAKKNEDLYLEGRDEPLRLPRGNPALRLLQRMRNEAHRFAIEYHRTLRRKRMRRSVLDEIPGVGPKRSAALLIAFGGLVRLRNASPEDMARIPGIGKPLARKIYDRLHE